VETAADRPARAAGPAGDHNVILGTSEQAGLESLDPSKLTDKYGEPRYHLESLLFISDDY
jgi:hypothetical protein